MEQIGTTNGSIRSTQIWFSLYSLSHIHDLKNSKLKLSVTVDCFWDYCGPLNSGHVLLGVVWIFFVRTWESYMICRTSKVLLKHSVIQGLVFGPLLQHVPLNMICRTLNGCTRKGKRQQGRRGYFSKEWNCECFLRNQRKLARNSVKKGTVKRRPWMCWFRIQLDDPLGGGAGTFNSSTSGDKEEDWGRLDEDRELHHH